MYIWFRTSPRHANCKQDWVSQSAVTKIAFIICICIRLMTWGKFPWKIFILVKNPMTLFFNEETGEKEKGKQHMKKTLQNQSLSCFVKKALNTHWKNGMERCIFLVCFLWKFLWKYVFEHFWQALKINLAKQSFRQSSIETCYMTRSLHFSANPIQTLVLTH